MFVVQEIPKVQFVERIQEQIVATIKMVSQELVIHRTSEQFEVQMNTSSTSTSKQTVDIPIPRGVEEIGDMSVQLSTHACMHSLKNSKEKVAKLEEVTSSLRSRLWVLTKSLVFRHAARQAEKELDIVVAQLREEDKKQLLAEVLREKQHLLNMKRRYLTRCSGAVLWTVCELATIREKTCDLPDTNIIFVVADRFRELNSTVKNRSLLRRRPRTHLETQLRMNK